MKKLSIIILFIACFSCNAQEKEQYFAKKKYIATPVPSFKEIKDRLPIPILTDNPELLDMYWKCWEIVFGKIKSPTEGSPFVSNYMDEAFSDNIFQWDMIFMMMFAKYAHGVFPAIESLDNFYVSQHDNGYICREISEKDGIDFVFKGRVHTINPPLFGWAEIENYKSTGSRERYAQVLPVLEKYAQWLSQPGDLKTADGEEWHKFGRKATNSVHTLYWNTGLGSGMDNTPRGGNGWVDMSCQMIMLFKNMEEMAIALNQSDKAEHYRQQADDIGRQINKWCWNEEDGLYYDVNKEGQQQKWKTSGCFWPMITGIASETQAARLVTHLKDPSSFWRKIPFPTLAADQENYSSKGDYWRGSVWAPTNYMIIKGLEYYGYDSLASESSIKYLNGMNEVFKNTGTVWENYMPDSHEPGDPSRPDFVGWTGIGPIALLIEQVLGINIDASKNRVIWRISRSDEHGIEKLKMGDLQISLKFSGLKEGEGKAQVEVKSTGEFDLEVIFNNKKTIFNISEGSETKVI